MAEGKSREGWERTAAVVAAVATASFHRDPRRPVDPARCNPWSARDEDEARQARKAAGVEEPYLPIDCLIDAWVKHPPRRGD
jgi:hypothetical protein